ncbi:hypothetical protein [Bradyrhizobium brasilense]|uniref:hypothetical protein n=1 Tax=Bradyrhizobium brasilense TaxID=1419277 RepID=UPI0030B88AC2
MIQLFEPPSGDSAPRIVFVGRNRRGNWVAREQRGAFGGLFVDRAQALKYALFENGRHPESIIEMTREIELDIEPPQSNIEHKKRTARRIVDGNHTVHVMLSSCDDPVSSCGLSYPAQEL